MYQIDQLIVYGAEGVCRVEHIGPLEMRGAQKDVDYYTLSPLYREGKVFAPVDSEVNSRPVMTREQAQQLIADIPNVPAEIYENSNPRLLNEYYQALLKSNDCMNLVRLIRAVSAKAQNVAQRGKRLGQVDERSMKRAQEMLHGELAATLEISVEEIQRCVSQAACVVN